MLHFTLPLPGEEGQSTGRGTELKTIQLFLLDIQDFHKAVSYLSQNAGMRHCHLKNVSANLMDTNAPQQAQSQSQKSSGTSAMEPPSMRPPMRPLSQASIYLPARHSPAPFIHRSQSVRLNPNPFQGDLVRHPLRPGTTVPGPGRLPPQGTRYRSSLPQGPQDPQHPRSFFAQDGPNQQQTVHNRSTGIGVGHRTPLYGHPMHVASLADHAPSSRPMQYNRREPPPSHHPIETGIDHIASGPYDDRFDGQPADLEGHSSFSARHAISMKAPLSEEYPSSRPAHERRESRFTSVSQSGLPIKIQVLGTLNEPSSSYTHPKIRWEFTLHLLPSTKMWELCLHAASYLRREYRSTVDGRALAAQSKDGTVFGDQDSLTMEVLQGEAVFLIERKLLGTVQPVLINSDGSDPGPSHPDWRTKAGKPDGPHPASSKDPPAHVIDGLDQVPPPRPLPFPLVEARGPSRSSSTTITAQSPLNERLDLANRNIRTRASKQVGRPISQNISARAATEKQPGIRQKRPPSASRRPASSASGIKPHSVSTRTQESEPRILMSRSETSLGIRQKRRAPSNDEGVSAAMPPATEATPSGAEVSKQELAATACIGCRRKKRKCDRSKPTCGSCLKATMPCTYPNVEATANPTSIAEEASKQQGLEAATHPMVLRSQPLNPFKAFQDASTQTSWPTETRDTCVQTQEVEQGNKEIHMKDVGTDPCDPCNDASTETDRCDEVWLPLSLGAEVTMWSHKRFDENLRKTAEIFKNTGPSHEDYLGKVEQAVMLAAEFQKELRDKCEEVLRR